MKGRNKMKNKNFNRFSHTAVRKSKVVSQHPPISDMENTAIPRNNPTNQQGIKNNASTDTPKDKSMGTDIFNLPKSDFERMNT